MNFLFSIETSLYCQVLKKLTQSDDELIISSKYITDRALDFFTSSGILPLSSEYFDLLAYKIVIDHQKDISEDMQGYQS